MIWTERSCVYFDETAIAELLIDKTAWFKNSRMPTILLACGRNQELSEQLFQACAIDKD